MARRMSISGTLRDLARKTSFVQRSTSRAEGEDFVRLMTTEIIGEDTVTTECLCDILRQINPGCGYDAIVQQLGNSSPPLL